MTPNGRCHNIKEVRPYCFCACLLHEQTHTLRINRALSNKMNNDRADGHCYSFSWISRFWTFSDLFFLDHFCYWFSTFSEKMKKICRLDVWTFWKMHHRIPFFWALRLFVQRFQMPLEGLSFVKNWQHLELFTQQTLFYKICLRPFASVDSASICSIRCVNLSKSGYCFMRFISKTKSVSPIFLVFLTHNSSSECSDCSVGKHFKR